jgi:hypothetical protein
MLNYYKDFPRFVSNSTLGDFFNAYHAIENNCENLQNIYNFGNLVDAMVTERNKLDFKTNSLIEESSGEIIPFHAFDWRRAEAMAESAVNDPVLKLILNGATFQHVVLRQAFKYEFAGNVIQMPTRCKFDILNKHVKQAADIKTTACETQRAFTESIQHFKYFRQGAIYMDLAEIDRMWYFGIGKKRAKNGKYPIFKFAIERGDATYNQGRFQYGKLGYLYKHIVYDLNIDNLMIAA